MPRGQVAMEFIMTYGWAIFIILIAVGALGYFGLLSPEHLLPDKCVAEAPFSCQGYKVQGGTPTNVALMITQNAGTEMVNVTVALTCTDGTAGTALNAITVPLNSGATSQANFTCPPSNKGDRWNGNFSITFQNSGETVSHTVGGSLQVGVE